MLRPYVRNVLLYLPNCIFLSFCNNRFWKVVLIYIHYQIYHSLTSFTFWRFSWCLQLFAAGSHIHRSWPPQSLVKHFFPRQRRPRSSSQDCRGTALSRGISNKDNNRNRYQKGNNTENTSDKFWKLDHHRKIVRGFPIILNYLAIATTGVLGDMAGFYMVLKQLYLRSDKSYKLLSGICAVVAVQVPFFLHKQHGQIPWRMAGSEFCQDSSEARLTEPPSEDTTQSDSAWGKNQENRIYNILIS